MPNKLYLQWPVAQSGSAAEPYARVFERRLAELGVHFEHAQVRETGGLLIAAQSAGAPLPLAASWFQAGAATPQAAPPLPALYDIESLLEGAGTALACRPDPALSTFLAFPPPDLDGEGAARLAALHGHLTELSPYPVRLVVVLPTVPAPLPAPLAQAGIACCSPRDADYSRHLLAADGVLLESGAAGLELLGVIAAGVPALQHLAGEEDAEAEPWQAGLTVSGATVRELAGLLVLLSIEPGLRRQVLDAQAPLQQALTPEHQRQALATWLHGLPGLQAAPRPDMPPPAPLLRVEGVFDSSYSLAIVNRRLALALEDLGEQVALYSYEQGPDPRPDWSAVEYPERLQAMWSRGRSPLPPAVSLRDAWPPVVRDMRAARRVLAAYAWEETTFPPEFAADFSYTLDLATAISTQTARLLQDAGVSTPMAVVGVGVDHLLGVAPAPLPRPLPPARFRFLHLSSCFPRKGADVLLKAYGRAFRAGDDVALVIKTFPNPHNDVAAQIEALRRADPGYPPVELIEEDWTQAQIVGLYRQCHALVAPSRAEGFGMPIAEAMLYQLPVIVTGWGGHLDFCRPDTAWLIDYTPEPAQTHLGLDDSLWAEPDADHLALLLKEVFTLSPADLAEKTEEARRRILDRYTWHKVAARIRDALRAVEARPGLPPELRVGWVSTWGSRCGIAAYSRHLVGAFEPRALHLFAPAGEATTEEDPPFVTRNWSQGGGRLDPLIAEIKARRLDALVIQHHWGFFSLNALEQLLTAMAAAGIKTYLEFHNTRSAPPEVARPAMIQALQGAERLLVHTVDDVQRLKALGLSDNVVLFPLAVYPVSTPAPGAVAAQRRRLGLEQRQVIASYGFLMPHKGLLQLLEAMPALLERRPNLHLLMANALYPNPPSAQEHQKIQDCIRRLGLAKHVTLQTEFLPEDESLALLQLADLAIFPYQNTEESSSAAVRMALAAGLPVAVTPLSIFADVAPAVFRLPGTDPASLAAGIDHLLGQLDQGDHRSAAVERSRQFVARRQADRLSRRLRGLIEGGRHQLPTDLAP